MEYFNAKIGMDNNTHEKLMGTYDVGEMNENGEIFAGTCALNNIIIGGKYVHTYNCTRYRMCVA